MLILRGSLRAIFVVAFPLAILHCDKKSEAPVAEKPAQAPQAVSVATVAAPGVVPPSTRASTAPSAASAVATAVAASASAPPAPLAVAPTKGSSEKGSADKDKPQAVTTASVPPAAPLGAPVRFQHATALYTLDASPPASCKAGAACEVVVRLEAKGAYHINKEYPYKLKAQPSDGVAFANTDGTFSKASGDFSQQGESVGLLKVRFTGQAPGQAKVRGVYKFSVCSESDCKLDQAEVAFETPIR